MQICMKNVSVLTLFHGMFFLKGRLNFLYLLCEEVYFAFEECLCIVHFLQRNTKCK